MIRALLLALALFAGAAHAADPVVRAGKLELLAMAPSKYVDPRPVYVWLPDDYAAKSKAGVRYKVLYVHDGQNQFDVSTTWNKKSWNLELTLARLIREGRIADTIAVAIPNNGKLRYAEYFPQKFLPLMPASYRDGLLAQSMGGKPLADNYLRFIVDEVKPAVDKRYATQADAAGTFLIGSSMGGLISVYGISEYPQVFGGAAGLSTHWVGSHQPNATIPLAAFNYLAARLPDPATHRVWQDHGTVELDALYAPYQPLIDQIFRERGYTEANYVSKVYPGTGHNEPAWADRLHEVLIFLLDRQ